MPRIFAWSRGTIHAAPQAVYEILADYRGSHAAILPAEHFSDYEVEEGGRGDGTVIRFQFRMLGNTTSHHAVVKERLPGRQLTETDTRTGSVTTFTVLPAQGGAGTELTISTQWDTPGLRGWAERFIAPRALRRVYQAEMRNLAGHVAQLEKSA